MNVTKRNGKTEKINLEKIHQVVEWAAEGLDVSVSQVELDAQIQFYEGIKTKDIHNTLIRAAADLISEETPDYQYLSARLAMFAIRKEAYGQYTPRKLAEQLEWGVDHNLYDKGLLKSYTAKELETIDGFVDHERDMNYAYAGIEQLRSKYLVQDRVTKQVYESPQTALILIAMAIFSEKYKGKQRLNLVRGLYDELSTFKVSLPTPIMAGVRTPSRQFSSCVLIECDDSLDSIKASSNAIVDYISRKAGIGLNVGRIRAEGSPIRNGEARHTGVIPFLKLFQASVKAFSQGGVRGGAATLFYPVWHKEFESLIVLKNNRGVEENRVRQLDYCVQLTGYFYEKLITGGDIHFFSPHEVPGMYEAYFADQDKFKELYEAAITDNTPKLKASEVFSRILQERAGTGRIYIQNADHCNTHSPFDPKVSPIRQSNLCVAPETQILTDVGYVEISSLEGEKVNVWNGEEFSEVEVRQTGVGQPLLKVTMSSGEVLECTPDHKWYLGDDKATEVRTKDLKSGDKLIEFTLPNSNETQKKVVESIKDEGRVDNTYCFTEPKRHMGMFNGILTGQCVEVALPTEPVTTAGDGEIALCTLAAVNLGAVETDAEIAKATEMLVRALDALLDYQEYPLEQAWKNTEKYRPLGVGVVNYATFLAKRGHTFSGSQGNNDTHKLFESLQYHLMLASVKLAKEFGPCKAWNTLRRKHKLPIHTYKKEVDEVHTQQLMQDWETLGEMIAEYGMRNATVSALMPSETSSQISNATNGIEPPRALVTSKQSKDGILKQVVPMLGEVQYETYWEMVKAGQEGNLEKIGIMQKFVDQTISANTGYDPNMYEGGRIPMQQMMKDLITAYRLGIKTLYYHNTRDSIDSDEDDSCDSGACKI